MSVIKYFVRSGGQPKPSTLDEVLVELVRYGKPRISYHVSSILTGGKGWSCNIEMNTTGKGCEFTIRSENYHLTPFAAAAECLGRVEVALAAR